MQVIAMHGWCGDHRGWGPLAARARTLGWSWQNADRGYGPCAAVAPTWPGHGRRVIVAHSLGLHLIPAELLQQADAMVLLASFGRFVPDGPEGRRLQVALRGMASELASEGAETMLHQFLVRAAAPQPFSQLPPTILEAPLNAGGRQRLQEDLDLLAATSGLPRGFPAQARCLIVEAERDAIVEPRARQDLREALPAADRLLLTGLGHALLATPWIAQVFQWIEQL